MADLRVTVCGMEWDSPFVLASGPPGWCAEGLVACARAGAGAVVTKSIGYEGVVNTTQHMVSPGGNVLLNNEGGSDEPLKFWLGEIPKAKRGGVKCLIASLSGVLDIPGCVDISKQVVAAGADMLEVVVDYHRAGDLTERIRAVKAAVHVPVLVKVNANWKNTTEVARLCAGAGADGITAIDSMGPVLRIDPAKGSPMLGGKGYGYLTGAPLLPFALRYVYDIAAELQQPLPIVGTGGVTCGGDALEMLMAGATGVGVCTLPILKGPAAFGRLCRELSDVLDRYGYGSARQAIGKAQMTGKQPPKTVADFTFDAKNCNGCGRCVTACAYGARTLSGDRNEVDAGRCRVCGLCFTVCPKRAIQL